MEKNSENLSTPLRKVYYCRLPQSLEPWPKDLSEVPDYCKFETYPQLQWGTGIYCVNEDGSLKHLESDYDSSG